jgi:hypothetical protein
VGGRTVREGGGVLVQNATPQHLQVE